jgi:hypothetical protein
MVRKEITMATKGIKNKKIEQVETKNILDLAKGMELNKVLSDISGLQITVQNSLATLSAALTNKIQNMETIDTAIDLKESRLKELYGIENMAITLDDMKAQQIEEENKSEITRQERARTWMEEEEDRQKKWKREQEQWEYEQAHIRKKWKDDFDNEVVTAKRNESARQEMLQKNWTQRETDIKSHEQEFANLSKQVTEFDAKLKAEILKAENITSANLKREYEYQTALLKKDTESITHAEKIKNAAYELTIKGLEEQIRDLRVQLTQARLDAKEVASQALQSASGRQVAEALQKVVERPESTTKVK